ncbi:uncharacterized protein [Coffea arabica]|uniref:Uncharacterized protein isoform X2 n=1 Tax=Coffea arabica TaxID=13443 RepID=A0A6P6X027_COFAR|nr:proteasome assembly chaperone 4 isoform X3 [Coffea arabica]
MGGLDEDEDCYHRRHEASSVGSCSIAIPPLQTLDDGSRSNGVEIISFSDVVDDATLHFHIIRLHRQIYAWIGCNSAKFGHLYAAAPTRPSNAVSVTSLIGGSSDNAGAGIARRIEKLSKVKGHGSIGGIGSR